MHLELAFADDECQICRKINSMMADCFEKVVGRIQECAPVMDPKTEFTLLCMSEGVERVDADNRFYADFGMSGDELLEHLYGFI